MELIYSGKVRDVYADGDDLLLVASDRVSTYDVVLPTPVPGKGRILTQLSLCGSTASPMSRLIT
jgi:phosphoribosylaminoimidazole-succinocarboxamide synthase